jgi:dTDP-glucose 4,6-dehydratase
MSKIVYVTGCLGFIGSYVTRKCLENGWYVRGIDKITYAANKDLLNEFNSYDTFKFTKCDINDLEFLYDCDYIINTAAETHVGNSIVSSHNFIHSNINGVHKLLELIRTYRQESNKIPILIHFSTDEVYGDIENGLHNESDILKPSNPYSASKAGADMLIKAWSRTYNIPYNIVRPTNNYGIGQYVEKLIPKSCKYLLLNRRIPLHNNGTPIRNWLHAEDTANAIMAVIKSGSINEIYNICGGLEKNNFDVVEKIIKLYHGLDKNAEDYLDFSIGRPGQDIRYALDDSKIRRLGWNPIKNFDEELVKIVEYYKNTFIW